METSIVVLILGLIGLMALAYNQDNKEKKNITSKEKFIINENDKIIPSSSGKKFAFGILRFVVVAVILGIGRELELDKQLGGLLTVLITLLAFVWVFRGNRLFTYRPGQNLWESKEKNKPRESISVRKKEYTPNTLEDISKEKAIKEIKELKELLDSGIISKTEYNKKAKELKKIILK